MALPWLKKQITKLKETIAYYENQFADIARKKEPNLDDLLADSAKAMEFKKISNKGELHDDLSKMAEDLKVCRKKLKTLENDFKYQAEQKLTDLTPKEVQKVTWIAKTMEDFADTFKKNEEKLKTYNVPQINKPCNVFSTLLTDNLKALRQGSPVFDAVKTIDAQIGELQDARSMFLRENPDIQKLSKGKEAEFNKLQDKISALDDLRQRILRGDTNIHAIIIEVKAAHPNVTSSLLRNNEVENTLEDVSKKLGNVDLIAGIGAINNNSPQGSYGVKPSAKEQTSNAAKIGESKDQSSNDEELPRSPSPGFKWI